MTPIQNLSLALVSDTDKLSITKMPPPVAQRTFLHLHCQAGLIEHSGPNSDIHLVPGALDPTRTMGVFYPIVFPNEFWQFRSHFVEINSTVARQPLRVTLHPMSFMKFQLYATMTVGFRDAAKQQGTGAEVDELKRMLTETNPYFLALTAIVTILHTV